MARQRRKAKEDVVRRAMDKQQRRVGLTTREAEELERFREQKELEIVRKALAEVPKTLFCEMAGRQRGQVDEQAARYRLPMGGPAINMWTWLTALFDFLAANKFKLAGADDDDPLMAGVSSIWMERYREERTKLVRMERKEKEGKLLNREKMHLMFSRMAEINQRTGKKLEKEFGKRALEIFNDGFKNAEREADRVFGQSED